MGQHSFLDDFLVLSHAVWIRLVMSIFRNGEIPTFYGMLRWDINYVYRLTFVLSH